MNLQNPPLAAPISHANRKLTSQRIADMHCAFKDGEKGGLDGNAGRDPKPTKECALRRSYFAS